MARICDNCGRRALKGNSRSHSNIATIKFQQVNLQYARIDGKRMRVCTSCLRSKTKAKTAARAVAVAK